MLRPSRAAKYFSGVLIKDYGGIGGLENDIRQIWWIKHGIGI